MYVCVRGVGRGWREKGWRGLTRRISIRSEKPVQVGCTRLEFRPTWRRWFIVWLGVSTGKRTGALVSTGVYTLHSAAKLEATTFRKAEYLQKRVARAPLVLFSLSYMHCAQFCFRMLSVSVLRLSLRPRILL